MDFLDEVLSYSKKQTSQVRDVVTELITFDNTQRRLEQAELRAYEFDLNQVYAVWYVINNVFIKSWQRLNS